MQHVQREKRSYKALWNAEPIVTCSQFQKVFPQNPAGSKCHWDFCTTIAENSVRGQNFEHLVEHALAGCRECRHGVLPSHIKSHVQRAHPAKRKQAKAIAEEVGNWAGFIQYAGELEVPSQVIETIHQLSVYEDGLMCQVDPNHCRRIYREPEGIREHWRDVHSWSAAGKGGHPTQEKQKEIQERISQHCKKVHCQRLLLVQGQGSQYFQVHQPGDSGPDVVPVDGEDLNKHRRLPQARNKRCLSKYFYSTVWRRRYGIP